MVSLEANMKIQLNSFYYSYSLHRSQIRSPTGFSSLLRVLYTTLWWKANSCSWRNAL